MKRKRPTEFGDQPTGSDICQCGEYRSQHNRDGHCRVCFGSRAPYDQCGAFRFSRCALDEEVKHWQRYHGSRVEHMLGKE